MASSTPLETGFETGGYETFSFSPVELQQGGRMVGRVAYSTAAITGQPRLDNDDNSVLVHMDDCGSLRSKVCVRFKCGL